MTLPRTITLFVLAVGLVFGAGCTSSQVQDGEEWSSLFDGSSIDEWRASEHKESFSVQNGRIVADGARSHLFYEGPVANANFDDFELRAEVMTEPGSNSGIYFHTEYQEEGWPSTGCEVQINNTYETDPRKTGSLYAIDDVNESPVGDNEWFPVYVRVEGNDVLVQVDGETTVDYTAPPDSSECVRATGTIALQAHDPESTVYFRNIRVNPLE